MVVPTRLANRTRRGEAGALIGGHGPVRDAGDYGPARTPSRRRCTRNGTAPRIALLRPGSPPCPPPGRTAPMHATASPATSGARPHPRTTDGMDPHMRASKPRNASAPPTTAKRMTMMLIVFAVVFGGVFALWFASQRMLNSFFDNMPQPAVEVSTFEARGENWNDNAEAVGTLVADNGTQVTTEAGGVVQRIAFESGQRVRKGDLLVQLNTANELAQLEALDAAARLAATQRDRWRELGDQNLVSRAEVDERTSDAAQTRAQAEAQRALIAQKTIRAPFDGVLGIRRINLGQYLNPGDPIVGLQALDPIHVDFTLPEQRMNQVAVGARVQLQVDAAAGREFEAEITAVEPSVDTSTRNFTVRASLANPDGVLRPGTFARVRFD